MSCGWRKARHNATKHSEQPLKRTPNGIRHPETHKHAKVGSENEKEKQKLNIAQNCWKGNKSHFSIVCVRGGWMSNDNQQRDMASPRKGEDWRRRRPQQRWRHVHHSIRPARFLDQSKLKGQCWSCLGFPSGDGALWSCPRRQSQGLTLDTTVPGPALLNLRLQPHNTNNPVLSQSTHKPQTTAGWRSRNIWCGMAVYLSSASMQNTKTISHKKICFTNEQRQSIQHPKHYCYGKANKYASPA